VVASFLRDLVIHRMTSRASAIHLPSPIRNVKRMLSEQTRRIMKPIGVPSDLNRKKELCATTACTRLRAWTRWERGRCFGTVVAAAVLIMTERMKGMAQGRVEVERLQQLTRETAGIALDRRIRKMARCGCGC